MMSVEKLRKNQNLLLLYKKNQKRNKEKNR
jgi:hypothetical protein